MSNKSEKVPGNMVVSMPSVDVEKSSVTQESTELKVVSGAITMTAMSENNVESVSINESVPSKNPNGTVVLDVDNDSVSVEISWDDMQNRRFKTLSERDLSDKLVGKDIDVVLPILNGMVENNEIFGFRVIEPGQSYTTEVTSGRVQILLDKNDKVQTIQVG